jgi:F-type H+-transporting ATPase subunit epsilon
MADTLRLRLYTPEQELLDDDVEQVIAPGAYGEIGVLPKHAALVTMLQPGVLRYIRAGKTSSVRITGGFAEVRDDVMTVLADGGEAVA